MDLIQIGFDRFDEFTLSEFLSNIAMVSPGDEGTIVFNNLSDTNRTLIYPDDPYLIFYP